MMSRQLILGLGIACFAAACGHVDDRRCQVGTDERACVSVVMVQPTYELISGGMADTNDVDVVPNTCEVREQGSTGTNVTIVPEPFGAHAAKVTIENRVSADYAQATELATSVTFNGYDINYFATDCTEQICPALETLSVAGETFTVKGGTEMTVTLSLMPLSRKQDYVNLGGGTTRYPTYNAQYILKGTDGNEDFELEAWTEFVVGSFNYCDSEG